MHLNMTSVTYFCLLDAKTSKYNGVFEELNKYNKKLH